MSLRHQNHIRHYLHHSKTAGICIVLDALKNLSPPLHSILGFPRGSWVKNLPANAGASGDVDSIPESEGSSRGGHDNPLQYSCLGNHMDRGAWQATVHGVTESDVTEVTCMLTL